MSEIIAAHGYRNGKIFCTVLIEEVNPHTYHVYREGKSILATASSQEEAMDMADIYLTAYCMAYDEGIEHASKEHPRT